MSNDAVWIIGDTMLERETLTKSVRLSREAPCPVARREGVATYPGGAGNLARATTALGVPTWLTTVVGPDASGNELIALLQGVVGAGACVHISHRGGETRTCERIFCDDRLVLRVVHEVGLLDLPELDQPVAEACAGGSCVRVIALADYARGAIDDLNAGRVIAVARRSGIPVAVDSRHAAVARFSGASLLKPNLPEALDMLAVLGVVHPGLAGCTETRATTAARCLANHSSVVFDCVVVTAGEAGAAYCTRGGAPQFVVAESSPLADTCGAGDAVFACLLEGLVRKRPLAETVGRAMVAGRLCVSRRGPYSPHLEEIETAWRRLRGPAGKVLASAEELQTYANRIRGSGGCLVLANGCFDGLHAGHMDMLSQARACGDALLVAVNDDASIRDLKGPTRPIVPQESRVRMLAEQHSVDAVYVFDGDVETLVDQARPDVLVKGEDARKGYPQLPGADAVARRGGRIVYVSCIYPFHASPMLVSPRDGNYNADAAAGWLPANA